MKSILITGANGFIGTNLIKEFKNKYKIFCLDKNNCDLKIKKKFPNVNVVIHLAAFNSTKDFYKKPLEVIEDNLLPTLNLLNHYRKQKKTIPSYLKNQVWRKYYGEETEAECPIIECKNIMNKTKKNAD